MQPLFIGYTEDNAPLTLGAKDLETHVHGIGASRSGKSKLIEWLTREMVKTRQGFCLIDPHGFLYQDVLRWFAYMQPRRELVLFDPSYDRRVVGFNPFQENGGDVSTQVDRRVLATIKAWGGSSTDQTPRLERWLRCLYHTLIEGGYTIDVARYLLTWNEKAIREHLVRRVRNPLVRNEWQELGQYTKAQEFAAQVESTRNRLFRFLAADSIRRIMGLPTNNLDLKDIIESGKILLVNLQPSDVLSDENARLLGTLLLNEIWEVGKRRRQTEAGGAPPAFYVVIDEFQKFLTADIPAMLDQAAKYGLHLMLFHQHLNQLKTLDEQAYGAVMTNARTKLVFGGLTRDDARIMVENIFPQQVDMKRVKHLIEQTKFWPVYGRDTVINQGTAEGGGTTVTTSMMWDPLEQEFVPAESTAVSENESFTDGCADIPFLRPEPFREVSSVEFYSLEEILWQMTDRLMEQYQRHFMIRRPGERTIAAVTPFVRSWYVTPECVGRYVEETLKKFLPVTEVDTALEAMHRKLMDTVKPKVEEVPKGVEGRFF